MAYSIRDIQNLLNKFGYGLKVDGLNGPKTQGAIRDFQSKHGLTVDGIVGDHTWGALNSSPTATAAATQGGAAAPAAGGVDPAAAAYPEYAWLINDVNVGPILRKAYAEHWPSNTLLANLQSTPFWRDNTDAAKRWMALQQTDPAEYQRRLEEARVHVQNLGTQLGVGLGSDAVASYADSMNRFGWSEEFLKTKLLEGWRYSANDQTGLAATIHQQILSLASQYLVPISDQTMATWEKQILVGGMTVEGLKGYVIEQAKSVFGGNNESLNKALDAGVTVRQWADPFVQQAARTLEIAPDSIDLTDPRWNRVLNQLVDPKTGVRGPMTLYDAERLWKTDPQYGYDKTSGARQTGAQLTTELAKTFGAVG